MIESRFQLYVMCRHTGVCNDASLIVVNTEGKRIFEQSHVKITHEYVMVQVDKIQ